MQSLDFKLSTLLKLNVLEHHSDLFQPSTYSELPMYLRLEKQNALKRVTFRRRPTAIRTKDVSEDDNHDDPIFVTELPPGFADIHKTKDDN